MMSSPSSKAMSWVWVPRSSCPLLFLAAGAGVSFLADLAGLALVAARPREELLGLPTFFGGILSDDS